ncbi:MAG: N-acetylglucosamine-6-phosphate deacetylase, partial [Cetobacterium sp.]
MKAIINGEVFLGNKFYTEKALIIDGERIIDIVSEETLNSDYPKIETIDAEKGYITPGFIDLQLNGCGGVLFNDDISLETL